MRKTEVRKLIKEHEEDAIAHNPFLMICLVAVVVLLVISPFVYKLETKASSLQEQVDELNKTVTQNEEYIQAILKILYPDEEFECPKGTICIINRGNVNITITTEISNITPNNTIVIEMNKT